MENGEEGAGHGQDNGPTDVPDLSDPNSWTAVKPGDRPSLKNAPSTSSVSSNSPGPSSYDRRERVLSYEEAARELESKIKILLSKEDFTTAEVRADLKFLQRLTREKTDPLLARRLIERLVKHGMAHVFLNVWRSVCQVNYLHPDHRTAFKNLQAALSAVWNCTDKSMTLCDLLIKFGVLQLFLSELDTNKYKLADYTDDNILWIVKAYLGILHNIVRMSTDSRKLLRAAKAVQILRNYLNCPQPIIKTKAYLILSYIISEDENAIINSNDDNLRFMIDILAEALETDNHLSRQYCFWASEITCGLNHLAVNDSNKARIVRQGALPLYVKLLESASTEEQTLGAAGLWILSFLPANKTLIKEEPGCLQALQTLASGSPEGGIRRAARGALWVLKTGPQASPSPGGSVPLPSTSAQSSPRHAPQDADVPHVMISYSWASQPVLVKLKRHLQANGYKVWMDVDNMSGSTLEAMALAVERASVVLVGLTQAFKESSSCRTEAEYAFQLRKEIIPLLLQPGYVPDGWLGALVGARLYFDFTEDRHFLSSTTRLIRELGSRGRLPGRAPLVIKEQGAEPTENGVGSMNSSASSMHSYMRFPSHSASNWNNTDVVSWLKSNQLEDAVEKFDKFNGDLLLQYRKMMTTAPEFFYASLERQLNLDLISTLRFAKALDGLQ